MDLYPGKNNNELNTLPFLPEMVNGRAMVNPHYRVELAPGTRYVIDSGAFQERDMLARLQPWQALRRQLQLEAQIEYGTCGMPAEAIVTYDMLVGVDEAIVDGRRKKTRGDEVSAAPAVFETLRSARYYKSQEHEIRGAIAYAAQGATVPQYLDCVAQLLPMMRPGRDWLALGGFCIIGRMPSLKKTFYEVLSEALAMCRARGINHIHILGVTVADAITKAIAIGKDYQEITLSTDSTGPEMCAVFGRGYRTNGTQERRYTKAQKGIDYTTAGLAVENITDYHNWLQEIAA